MIEFAGTLIAIALCGLALGIGVLLRGIPVRPGCSAARCAVCPHRQRAGACERSRESGEPAA